MSNLTVTGVDLGSSSVKIAAVLKGGVQIITNQANFRQTPNVIGFLQSQRLIGEQGQVKIKSNHSNTVIAPSRYLGFNKEHESIYLEEQLKSCPCRSTYANSGQKDLKFLIPSTKDSFYPEQIVASYISQIQKIISQTNSLQNKHMTIAVPSYFSQHQRKALLNSIQISNKKISKGYTTELIDEQVAISMDYGFSRRNEFHEEWSKSKNVLFIDFGHSKTNIFVTAFNKNHMRVLANKFNRQLGCKFLDQQILKFYAQSFDNSHPNMDLNLLQSKKAKLKLLEAIQKQRKILSGINQHQLNIECLLQEEDFNYTIKRDQYQNICQNKLNQFKSMLINFAQQLKDKSINFDLIQLIGGGTRIPIILKIINDVFHIQPSRTINSSQCIAKGAALISAMNSAIFKVHQYAYFNVNNYPISLKVNGNVLEKRLIEKNQLVIKQKVYEFEIDIKSNDEKIILEAEYQKQSIQNGLEKQIFTAQINLKYSNVVQKNEMQDESQQNLNNIFKFQLKVSINQNGLYEFNNINAQDKNISLKIAKINTFQKFTAFQLQQMQEKQKQMTLRDINIRKFYQKKNQFQGFIYKSRQKITNFVQHNKEYISQGQIKQIQNNLDQQQKYLYDYSQQMTNSEQFVNKSQIMNQKIDKLFIHANQVKQAHVKVNNQLNKLMNYINEIITKRAPQMYPQQVNKTRQWLNLIIQKQKSQPKYNLPIVKVEQLQNILQNLSYQISQFDNQIQRQRINSQKGQRRPYQQYQRRPETAYHHPYEEPSYSHSQHQQQPYRNPYQHGGFEPRKTRSTRNKNNSNTFGSGFFGSGFPSFF